MKYLCCFTADHSYLGLLSSLVARDVVTNLIRTMKGLMNEKIFFLPLAILKWCIRLKGKRLSSPVSLWFFSSFLILLCNYRSKRIDTGKLKHEHWLNKQNTTFVIKFKKDITKNCCAVCRTRLVHPNFPEETFQCNRCPDFYICKSCFNRQNYSGQQNCRKISSSDMKLVSEKVCLPSECRCFKCRIKIEIKLGR